MADYDLFYVRHVGTDEEVEEQRLQLSFEDVLEKIDAARQKMKSQIGAVIDKKKVSRGEWDAEERVVRVTDQKSLNQYIPLKNKLQPYEALFYIECRTLAVKYNDLPLSIQDAYRLMLSAKDDLPRYSVFARLSRNGYFVDYEPSESEEQAGDVKKTASDQEMASMDHGEASKKLKSSSLCDSNDANYQAVINLRPLDVNKLARLNRFDRKLLSDSNTRLEEANESFVYDVETTEFPVPVHHELSSLFSPSKSSTLRPLLSLGEVPTFEDLFARLQDAGPKEYSPQIDRRIRPDFYVYRNRKAALNRDKLFSVVFCGPYDTLPSVDAVPKDGTCPTLFCLLDSSLDHGYSRVDNFSLQDQMPMLWRALALQL